MTESVTATARSSERIDVMVMMLQLLVKHWISERLGEKEEGAYKKKLHVMIQLASQLGCDQVAVAGNSQPHKLALISIKVKYQG